MTELPLRNWWLAALFCGSVLAGAAQTNHAAAVGASKDRPPLPQLAKPYTAFFRQLLVVTPAEQEKLLAGKPSATRQVLERKLQEYRSLPAVERELRLRALDLRWYLTQFMALSPERRQELLPQVPEEDRALLEQRLRQWDELNPTLQDAWRRSQVAIRILCNPATPGSSPNAGPAPATATQPTPVDGPMARWKALPPERRQEVVQYLSSLLELGEKERLEALRRLSELERAEWLDAVRAMAKLPKAERERCLRGFRQFAALPRAQREQFMRSAALWHKMSPGDQQVWRSLASQLPSPPPLPPGRRQPGTPPLPPTGPAPVITTTVGGEE